MASSSSAGASEAGRRRAQRGADDSASTSKKKQKDRANQESREAKRAAAGANAETKKDVFLDWKQNADEVIVRLRCGEGVLKVEDVDSAFSDTACQVAFPDGRKWSCHLHADIESSCSKVLYKEKGSILQLVMHKKIPFNTWPSLMQSKKENEPVNIKTDGGKRQQTSVAKSEKSSAAAETLRPPVQPATSSEQKRGKSERGTKRGMKNKPSEKAEGAGGKVAEGLVPEPSAKRTVRTAKSAKDPIPGSGPARDPQPSVNGKTPPLAACDPAGSSTDPRDNRAELQGEGRACPTTQTEVEAVEEKEKGQAPVPEPGEGPHGAPVPEPREGSQEAPVPEPREGPQEAPVPQLREGPQEAPVPEPREGPQEAPVPEPREGPQEAPVPEPREGPQEAPVPEPREGPQEAPLPEPREGPQQAPVPEPREGPQQAPVPEPREGPQQAPVPELREGPQQAPESQARTPTTEHSHRPEKPTSGTTAEGERELTERRTDSDAENKGHAVVAKTPPSHHLGSGEPALAAVSKEDHCPSKGSMEEEKRDQCKEESQSKSQEEGEVPEPMVNLKYVKNDSYEKGTDLMVVNVYMKGICRVKARVLFREQDFTLIFQTRNLIQPEQSTYAFTPSHIDISLKKRHSQRWGGLEAPTSQAAVGGAKVAVPSGPSLDKSQPGSSQHALPTKEEPRAGEEKPKPKPKPPCGPEDGGLHTVAPRSVSEHVPIKQELAVTTPKPTCMVQPMTHAPPVASEHTEEEEEKKVCLPGFTGLVNLGNTCFMNSVIQSLSNTRELRDYFHDRAFESEINCSNPLGTGGRLAIGFAVLLRALWKGTHHAFQPSKLKAIVASKASQFTGYAQHDAQEFMAFLLDGLHEDLNRIQNKPYTETVDSDGRLDEVVAEEAWQRHKMRNDSFIVDLFQGQYKSKLVCPVCSKVSITFDPFLYLPVPLPQKQKVLTVFYFAKEPHKKPIKFLVSVSKDNASTVEVLESISRSVRIKPENLRLAEVVRSRFHRVFLPSHSLDTVSSSDMLFCFEVLSKELAKEKVVLLQVQQRPQVPSTPISKCAACQKPPLSEEEKLKRCTRCYRVGYCNQSCQKNHWPNHKAFCRPNVENVGMPFLVSVPESRLTYARLTLLLEGYSRYSVNVFQPPFQSGRTSPEASQCRGDLPPAGGSAEGAAPEGEPLAGDTDGREGSVSAAETPTETGQASARSAGEPDSLSTRTSDSGFSELASSSQDPLGEKETSCEKAVKPEAAVTGYQQPSDPASGSASQFYISLLDSNNKEQRLEDKGEAMLEVPEDCTVELVWKNNERLKEYVLVRSKELEFQEDPGSVSETARAGHFTLEQCLNLFTKPEVLAPEEAWYCPKCQQHREASKQLLLWRLPNVLIIQLKRFSFRSFIWRDKINDMVDFPVRNLDLSKFCIGQKEDVQQHPPIYDLYAVINHYGGMIGGHYTAYARLPSDKNSQRSDVGWRLFDDSTVTTVEENQVVTRYAYVLFYRRRNSPVERPPRFLGSLGAESPASAGAAASQASSQALFGTDLDPEGPPQLTPEVTSDLFAHSGECSAPSYSNMEEVD